MRARGWQTIPERGVVRSRHEPLKFLWATTTIISGTADRLRRCQLSSPVSVINFSWSSDNCWSHPPLRSVFSS